MSFLLINIMLFICSFFNKKILFYISFFISLLYFCFTFGRGFDWINYYDIYLSINPNVFELPFEPGYYIIMRVFHYFGSPFSVMMAFTTLVMFSFIFIYCRRMQNPTLSFFTLISFMGHYLFSEQVRQGLAICIILYGFPFFERKQYVKAFLIILIAMLFHVSAIFCLLFFFIIKKNESFANIKFSIYCLLFLMLSYYIWSNPAIVKFIPLFYSKMIDYSTSYTEGFISVGKILSSKVAFLYIVMLVLSILILKKTKNSDVNRAIKALIFMTLTKITIFFGRFQYYVMPLLISGLDDYFSRNTGRKISFYKVIYVTSLFVISLVPLWTPSTYTSINDPIYIGSSVKEVEGKVGNRCMILNKYDKDNNAIWRCR
ncbi:EpsG family protein [Klebsiella variicola]|nr:EpsG family protein [Klebsiella variicola]